MLCNYFNLATDIMANEKGKAEVPWLMAMEGRLTARINAVPPAVTTSIKKVVTEVSTDSLGGLLEDISEAMRTATKLDGDALATTVSERVSLVMASSTLDMRSALQNLDMNLRSALNEAVTVPMNFRHDAIVLALARIAPEVATALTHAQSGDGVRMETLLSTLQQSVARGLEAQAMETGIVRGAMDKVGERVEAVVRSAAEGREDREALLAQIPQVVKGVLAETLNHMETESVRINACVLASQEQMSRMERELNINQCALANVVKVGDGVAAKMDQLMLQKVVSKTKSACDSRYKGAEAEDRIVRDLTRRLHDCELGWARSAQPSEREAFDGPESCDILIRCLNHNNVRVECKAYTRPVPKEEVSKFRRDMVGRCAGDHSLFVALTSGIAGPMEKQDISLEYLGDQPSRYAFHLSLNEYDIYAIVCHVRILHELDHHHSDLCDSASGGADQHATGDSRQSDLYGRSQEVSEASSNQLHQNQVWYLSGGDQSVAVTL